MSDRSRKASRRALGLCVDCKAPSPAAYRCAACARANKERIQALLVQRRAGGLCVDCGAEAFGRRYCAAHADSRNMAARARADAARKRAKCLFCPLPADGAHATCKDHHTAALARSRIRRGMLVVSGLCSKCGRPSASERCGECRASHAADTSRRHAELRALGLCRDCKAPSGGLARCPACAAILVAKRKAARRRNGVDRA